MVIEYSEEQIQELTKCLNDPVYFIKNYAYVQHPIHGKVLFNVELKQENLITQFYKKRIIVKGKRQEGISVTTALYVLWVSIFTPYSNTLIFCQKLRYSKDFIEKIRFAYNNLPEWLKPKLILNNKCIIEFDNGSRIYGEYIDCCSGRGHSPTLIIVENITYCKLSTQYEFLTSMNPHFFPNCQYIITTTLESEELADTGAFGLIWNNPETFNKVDLWLEAKIND